MLPTDEIDERGFVIVLELIGLEPARLLFDDVPGEIEHVLGDFNPHADAGRRTTRPSIRMQRLAS